jgi:3D (Asp-Asp-Asp) domain-containing protein
MSRKTKVTIVIAAIFTGIFCLGLFTGLGISAVMAKPAAEIKIEIPAAEIPTAADKVITESEFVSLGAFEATAYCPCKECCGKTDGITASGTKAKAGRTIAADTSLLPFGTQIYIDGKAYTVEDTGGAIKGNKIDIYFDTHTEALNYGRRQIELYKIVA